MPMTFTNTDIRASRNIFERFSRIEYTHTKTYTGLIFDVYRFSELTQNMVCLGLWVDINTSIG